MNTDKRNTARTLWRKSGRSGGNGNCVEIADLAVGIGVRDGKAPDAGYFTLTPRAWAVFSTRAKAGHYDQGADGSV